jgi:outer membrane protein
MTLLRIKSVGITFLFVFFALCNSSIAKAEMKFAVMNVQRIIVECEAGTAAKARFDDRMKELQTTFKAEEQELKELQAEIKKKSSAWSEEKKAEKVREFQKSGRELQAKTEDARFEMKQMQDKELEPILKALEKVVKDFGKKNGYTAIFDSKNGVIYFEDSLDVTDKIVKALNAEMAKK